MQYHIDFQPRTMAWMAFFGFNTMSWTVIDPAGYVIEFGWGRRKKVYADANAALRRAYAQQPVAA